MRWVPGRAESIARCKRLDWSLPLAFRWTLVRPGGPAVASAPTREEPTRTPASADRMTPRLVQLGLPNMVSTMQPPRHVPEKRPLQGASAGVHVARVRTHDGRPELEWHTPLMRFVVTGTGRSGTGYAASLFNAAGLSCGHESVYKETPGLGEKGAIRHGVVPRAKAPLGRVKETVRRRIATYDGDASWMAVPRLEKFGGTSFLQLRHPLLVVRSFVGTRFFSRPEAHRQQWAYAAAHFDITGDDVSDAMRWWVSWNERAAVHATMTYALERLDEVQFASMLARLGVADPDSVAAKAMQEVPKDVNSSRRRGDEKGTMQWHDLPDGADKSRLEQSAERWGYDPSQPDVLPEM